jgi:hypothetical protein
MKKTSLNRNYAILFVLILSISVVGCANRSTKSVSSKAESTKTTKKIKKLQASTDGLFFNNEKFHLYSFDALEIAPLDIFLSADYPDDYIDEDEAKRLKVKYFLKMKNKVSNIYGMPNKESKQVLILRTTLIDVLPDEHNLNISPMRALKNPIDVSDTALMVEFVDANSNETLASLFDEDIGGQIKQSLVREWSDADKTFEELATILQGYILSTQSHSEQLRTAINYDMAEFH